MSSQQADRTPFSIRAYLAPRYWLTWLGLGFLRLAVLLPFSVQIFLGKHLGNLLYLLPSRPKRIAAINIGVCFPELDRKQQKQILKKNCQSVGIALFELGMCWWALDKLVSRCDIEGLDRLENSIAKGNGVILLTPHFTTLEIGGSVLYRYSPLAVMYRDQKNKLFSDIMVRSRLNNCTHLVPRNDIRTLLRCLKKSIPIWYAPDQNYYGKQFIFSRFFNIEAATTTATARLAQITGADILPFYQIRQADNKQYRMVIGDALENVPLENIDAATGQINLALENMIRQAPEQYLWAHRRFKVRPEGEPPLY